VIIEEQKKPMEQKAKDNLAALYREVEARLTTERDGITYFPSSTKSSLEQRETS
jgi:hypothetical protein